jgi:mannose-6-phosphate isomerase-like protein (cupin superfamily)
MHVRPPLQLRHQRRRPDRVRLLQVVRLVRRSAWTSRTRPGRAEPARREASTSTTRTSSVEGGRSILDSLTHGVEIAESLEELYGAPRGVGGESERSLEVSTGPDVSSDQGRIQAAQAEQGFDQETTVLTSRDKLATTLMNALPAEGLAAGFHGQLIPIVFGSRMELDVLSRVGTTTGPHNHDTDGFHQILNGTVRVSVSETARLPGQDLEVDLGPGDWVWIPARVTYTLEIVANPVRFRYRH